jgi:hypothetical protein
MFLETVNTRALVQASEALVGPQVTGGILKLYQLIDRAMKEGYDLGKLDAEQNVEQRIDAAFDNGFEQGQASQGSSEWGVGYDQGYLDGVGDARGRPAQADTNVIEIINLLSAEAINGEFFDDGGPYNESFDITNVTDSGDEA